ncbi:hypothetical protein BEL04_20760 [Mucilaginibacter sp. PPCGB 2223]|uniref:hypothetical protein n=1 Tax=Mucilaginibacter sp. PPCGB 2223 TaxID=1886027 RepID=UPI000824BA29|nr:hypothetical protein [Mucilaginibacter sp. PPCGB 2223]OCX51143.1 hypothetical protein BEL04_20760 [Mucilaginibacter sp. PPCGB 2223]
MSDKSFDPKFMGFLMSNLLAFAIIGLSALFLEHDHTDVILVFSEFIIIPILMGLVCAWYWLKTDLSGRSWTANVGANSLIAVFLSSVFLHEGVICLLIVSPLIFCFMLVGTAIGKAIFKRNNQNLNVSVFALLALIFVADSLSKHDYKNVVSDSIVINATPDKIWKNVVSFEPIKQKNTYWLFRIGMPSPMATTVTGQYNGAGRKCIFSNGYVFGEKIVTYDENKDLTFDIIDQPRDPEIMGHIDIERGQFLLKDNGNGTTTLIGNSWYKLYVFPVWYYDIWAQSITRNVHLRVMQHIKELSEKN